MEQKNHNYTGWEELPQKVRDEFDACMKSNKKAIQLRQQIELYQRTRNYIKELDARKKLDEATFKAQRDVYLKFQNRAQKMTLRETGLSNEQLDKVNILMIATYMACDMIEFFAVDVNSILQKQDKTARFEMFDPIRKVGKEARANLSYLWKNTSMFDTEVFNDNSDDMREMLVNKAKKVYRKYAKHVADKEQGNATQDGKELV
jgi:hypothetical protein